MCSPETIQIIVPGGVHFFALLGFALFVFVLLRILGYFFG